MFIIIKSRSNDEDDEDMEDSEHTTIKVAVYEEKAYWVYQNTFYESEITREPDFTTAKVIDIMEMSTKQLDELFTILDELEEEIERD